MGNVIDLQERKASRGLRKPLDNAVPKAKQANTLSRLLGKAFWHALSSVASGVYSVARTLGVAITLLAKLILCVVTVLVAYAYFGGTSPDYHGMLQMALWYPITIGGCLAYKGLVYLLHKLASYLATTANQRTWR